MIRRTLLVVGAVALALAALVASPLPPDAGVRLPSSSAVRVLLGVAGLVVGLSGLAVLLSVDRGPARAGRWTTDRRATEGHTHRVTGAALDANVESLAADGEASSVPEPMHGPRSYLVSELRDLAVVALVERGHDRETAERLVATGEWTDDRRAAAFLGEAVPPVPLRLRVRDWATGDGERRHAERAIEEVADLADAATADEEAAR